MERDRKCTVEKNKDNKLKPQMLPPRNTKNISSDRKFKKTKKQTPHAGKDRSRKTTIRKEEKQGYGFAKKYPDQILLQYYFHDN